MAFSTVSLTFSTEQQPAKSVKNVPLKTQLQCLHNHTFFYECKSFVMIKLTSELDQKNQIIKCSHFNQEGCDLNVDHYICSTHTVMFNNIQLVERFCTVDTTSFIAGRIASRKALFIKNLLPCKQKYKLCIGKQCHF